QQKVAGLAAGWSAHDYTALTLTPAQGDYQAQRRASACRRGPRRKGRTFWVDVEDRAVPKGGTARLRYATRQPPQAGQPVVPQEVLLRNDRSLAVAAVVAGYDWRWPIERFLKELPSTLGLGRYRLLYFRCVEGWVRRVVWA